MLPGTIILIRGSKLTGWGLRTILQSPVQHARMAISDTQAIEATHSGVVVAPAFQGGDGLRIMMSPPTPELGEKAVSFARKMVGERYSWVEIAGIIVRFTFGDAPAVRFDRGVRSAVICSTLVAVAYKSAGYDIAPGVPAELVTPADLLIAASASWYSNEGNTETKKHVL